MKIVVDYELCDGNGVCFGYLPQIFDLDDDYKAVVLEDSPPESLRKEVELAVQHCPKAAIRILEGPQDPGGSE